MAILTISREYGSGGREIGRMAAERLTYTYVDKERLYRELTGAGARWEKVAQELDEVCPTLWERHDWEYRGYVALVEATIMAYAAQDRVVLIGRGGANLLRQVPFCLRVRLLAPLKVRIDRIMAREGLDRTGAERLIRQVDGERACFIKANYGVDWEAESLFDMTLNTASLPYEQVVDLIVAALAEKDRLTTPEARSRLQDMALAYRLKARVATDPRVMVPTLEVKAEEGVFVVAGIVHTPKELRLIQEITQEVVGSREVRFELSHRR